MKKILVDTSVLIDFLRREDKERTLFFKLTGLDCSLAISLVTHTELFSGKSVWQKKKAKKELEDLLSGLDVIFPNKKVSRLAGKFKAKYRVGLLDALIAAESIVSYLPLATLNVKDFKKIKEIKIFKVSNIA